MRKKLKFLLISLCLLALAACGESMSSNGQNTDAEPFSSGKADAPTEQDGASDETDSQSTDISAADCSEATKVVEVHKNVVFDTPPELKPTDLNIEQGDVVKWSGISQDASSLRIELSGTNGPEFYSPEAGSQSCYQFDKAGEFTYRARFGDSGPWAKGTINVQSDDEERSENESFSQVDCVASNAEQVVDVEKGVVFDTPPTLRPKEASISKGDVVEWVGSTENGDSNLELQNLGDSTLTGERICLEFNKDGEYTYEIGFGEMSAEGRIQVGSTDDNSESSDDEEADNTGESDESSDALAHLVDCDSATVDKTVVVEKPVTFDTPPKLDPERLTVETGSVVKWRSAGAQTPFVLNYQPEDTTDPDAGFSLPGKKICAKFIGATNYPYRIKFLDANMWTDGLLKVQNDS